MDDTILYIILGLTGALLMVTLIYYVARADYAPKKASVVFEDPGTPHSVHTHSEYYY
jgi:TctA family transporter